MQHDIAEQTVLITGGAGFIGSHIADALVAENDVRVVDNFSSGSRSNLPDAVSVYEGDIRDDELLEEAIEGVDLVFHEAALVSVAASVESPLRSNAINNTATLSLLEHVRREDARIVVASSAAIYGQPTRIPIAEDDPKHPRSPYGIHKQAIDQYVRMYADLYDVEAIALRYFNVYGPRQAAGDYSGVIRVFAQQAASDAEITVHGDGSQTRDFVHVSDVVQANLRAANTDISGRAYNIGTGTSVSIAELASLMKEAFNSDAAITHVEARPGDIDRSCASIDRARAELGFEPTVSLDEGLKTVDVS